MLLIAVGLVTLVTADTIEYYECLSPGEIPVSIYIMNRLTYILDLFAKLCGHGATEFGNKIAVRAQHSQTIQSAIVVLRLCLLFYLFCSMYVY